MTLHDPSPSTPRYQSRYPGSKGGLGVVPEAPVLDEAEDAFELRHVADESHLEGETE
jgi:hypothetical protein